MTAAIVVTSGSSIRLTRPPVIAPTDTTAPVFVGAQVANASPAVLRITMDEALVGTLPATSAFPVTVNGISRAVSSVVSGGAALINLTIASAIVFGDTVLVSYVKPGSNPLEDAAGNETASFGPFVVINNVEDVADPPPAAPSTFFSMGAGAAPDGNYVDGILLARWENTGVADWWGANLVAQSSVAFDSFTINDWPGTGYRSLNVTGIVDKAFDGSRQLNAWGILLRNSNGSGIWFSSNENVNTAERPKLTVVTPNGTFQCAVLFDVELAGLANDVTLRAPCIIQCDLAAVTGWDGTSTAQLEIFHSGASGAVFPCVISAFAIRTPRIPVLADFPLLDGGLRATMTEEELEANPDVFYGKMTEAEVAVDWTNALPLAAGSTWLTNWLGTGLSAVRLLGRGIASGAGGKTLANWWKFLNTLSPAEQFQEYHISFNLWIDPDLKLGSNEGMKLNGMGSSLMVHRGSSDYWDYLVWMTKNSPANPGLYRLGSYCYDYDNWIATGNAQGRTDLTNLYLREDQDLPYSIEQRVKLNTIGVSNGEHQIIVDNRDIWSRSDLNIRASDTLLGIDMVRMQAFHGGGNDPYVDVHLEFGPFVASRTARVGALTNYPAWRGGLPVGVSFSIPGSAPNAATGMGAAFDAGVLKDFSGLATDVDDLLSYSFCGGGHDSSHQSGGYKFDWRTGGWSLVLADTGQGRYDIPPGGYHPNGIPNDAHNYYAVHMFKDDGVPVWVRVWCAAYGGTAGNHNTVCSWDSVNGYSLNGAGWTACPDTMFQPATGAGDVAAPCTCQDPRTKLIYTLRPILPYEMGMAILNPFTREFTTVGPSNWARAGYVGSCIDILRDRMIVGLFPYGVPSALAALDLNGGLVAEITLNGPGAVGYLANYGGNSLMHYVPLDYYFALNSYGEIYKIHPTTGYTELFTTTVSPAVNQGGPFSRAMMLPLLRGIGWVATWTNEVQFIPLEA